MSSINQRVSTGQQLTTDFDLSKIFLLNNRYESDSYVNNSTYNPISFFAGTVMGRIASSNVLVPCISGALDGSQFPIGVLAQDVIALPAGQSQQVAMCIDGDVAANKLIWLGGDSLRTVTNGRTNQDHLKSYGILVRTATEMTDFDN